MEFYFDVDGVLLDFEKSFLDMVRERYLPELPKDFTLRTWQMTELKDVDIAEAWKYFMESNWIKNLPPICDPEAFNQISSQYKVHLVTNIPSVYLEKRQENLKNLGFQYDGIHPAGNTNYGDPDYPTKSQVIHQLWNREKKLIFLDDHPDNCQEVKKKHPEAFVFLMTRPHNKNAPTDPSWIRINNWSEFFSSIDNL